MDKSQEFMTYRYIAGYFDGEASLLFSILQDRRERTKNSRVEGWSLNPCLCVTSFDFEVLKQIKAFLESKGYKVYKLETKKRRKGNTAGAIRLSIFGWHNIFCLCRTLHPYVIAKRKQFELFLELYNLWKNRDYIPNNPYHRRGWNKQTYLAGMHIVDQINSLKSRKRGKMNEQFFRALWDIG